MNWKKNAKKNISKKSSDTVSRAYVCDTANSRRKWKFVAHTSLGTVRKRKAVSANRRKRAPGERRRKKKQKLCHYDNEKPSRACSHTTHSYCDTHYHNWAPPLDRVLSFVLGGVEEKRKSKKNHNKSTIMHPESTKNSETYPDGSSRESLSHGTNPQDPAPMGKIAPAMAAIDYIHEIFLAQAVTNNTPLCVYVFIFCFCFFNFACSSLCLYFLENPRVRWF